MCPRGFFAVGIAWGLLAASSFAFSAPARVRLSRLENGSPLVRELTARTAGEVVAAGFSVDLQDLLAPDPSASDPIPDGEPTNARAAVASIVVGAGGGDAEDGLIEITIDRQLIYRAAILRAEVGAADSGRVLAAAAVRAVAALQAALLDRQRRATVATVAPSPPSATRVDAAPPSPRARVGIGLAASMLQSLQGLPGTFAPSLRINYRATPAIVPGIRLMALGTSATQTAPAGSARVRQDLALCDVLIRFRPDHRIHPVLVGGLGVYHMSLQGSGISPFVGRGDSLWGVAADVGVGLFVDITPWISVGVESHSLWVWPQPAVRIDSVDVGRTGRPALSHGLGLVVWL